MRRRTFIRWSATTAALVTSLLATALLPQAALANHDTIISCLVAGPPCDGGGYGFRAPDPEPAGVYFKGEADLDNNSCARGMYCTQQYRTQYAYNLQTGRWSTIEDGRYSVYPLYEWARQGWRYAFVPYQGWLAIPGGNWTVPYRWDGRYY